jgi:hypothetical protein
MYCLFCDVLCIVCVSMCTELLPPGATQLQLNISYIVSYISYHTSYHIIFLNTVTPCLHLVSTTRGFPHKRRPQKAICDVMCVQNLLIRVGFCRLFFLCHKVDFCSAEALMASDTNILASINFIAIFCLCNIINLLATYVTT